MSRRRRHAAATTTPSQGGDAGRAEGGRGVAAAVPAASPRQKLRGDEVAQVLAPGQSLELLRELHLLTRGGEMNADALRKIKQVNHLLQLVAPAIEALYQRTAAPTIVDAGAGNAILGLLLYHAVVGPRGAGQVIGVERRAELCARAQERAVRLGMERFSMHHGEVQALIPAAPAAEQQGDGEPEPAGDRVACTAASPGAGATPCLRPDAVLALHACDRATDEALLLGLRSEAAVIALVPCCQAEVAALLQGQAPAALGPLWRHGVHRRELGAHLTNVIRALVLEAHGYRVRVTELVGWEHSIKNELLIAERHQRSNGMAWAQLRRLLRELPPLPMWLLQQVVASDS